MIKTHKILLIEPSQIIIAGLSALIEQCNSFTVAAALPDLSHYSASRYKAYDMVIINPMVVNLDQRSNIKLLLALPSSTAVIAVTYNPLNEEALLQYDGYIYLCDNKEQISRKLNKATGKPSSAHKADSSSLSSRERSILAAVAKGKTNKEIAEEFNISIYTVVTHRKNISHKLGISTISGLTVYAILNKLVNITEI